MPMEELPERWPPRQPFPDSLKLARKELKRLVLLTARASSSAEEMHMLEKMKADTATSFESNGDSDRESCVVIVQMSRIRMAVDALFRKKKSRMIWEVDLAIGTKILNEMNHADREVLADDLALRGHLWVQQVLANQIVDESSHSARRRREESESDDEPEYIDNDNIHRQADRYIAALQEMHTKLCEGALSQRP